MYKDNIVIDAVAHAFNFESSNFASVSEAQSVVDLTYAIVGENVPPGYALSRDAVVRNWPVDDTAAMLFGESDTDLAVMHTLPVLAFKDGMSSLEKSAEALQRYPNRFIGAYAAVDPLAGKAAYDALDRQIDMLNPIGLKLYPTSWNGGTIGTWRMDDPAIAFPLFEYAAKRGITNFAVHKAIPLTPAPTGESFRPGDVEGAAEHFPDLNFEIVHGGAAFTEETAWLLGRYSNIWVNLETLNIVLVTRPRVFGKILLGLMHIGGAAVLDRLIWGTGTMQYHPRPCLEAFFDYTLPEDLLDQYGLFEALPQLDEAAKAKILGGNYARMHGFDMADLRRRIQGDAFCRGAEDKLPAPYSTTSVAAQVVA
ncbi:amidohydrolase family protein [Novosphingobium colocasiae]|uniref:Amidohydrolase n=1 Tax=Novosphingobium colocasiae TaxID=1256513 RepID=A0A918UDQ8_9SPHN|nr:amidohydrolase family protein [Novosphingobium colocasiae]GGY93212.1 amidohydrolase [Novosphingobium colocasiae]